jgi:protein-L-isoaspartate(D-aspartate) O-methyltransferase
MSDPGDTPRDAARRADMVDRQCRRRGIADARVLAALGRVRRHAFVPPGLRDAAYGDHALAIGHDQTISQPYIVACMTEAAAVGPTDRALDVGTGSGYQAAVLAELAGEVYSIERMRIAALAQAAEVRLAEQGYDRVQVRVGDGSLGWPDAAPFDVILVAAGAPGVPPALVAQLAEGGRLVLPIGVGEDQALRVLTRRAGGLEARTLCPVRFVPLIGAGGFAASD